MAGPRCPHQRHGCRGVAYDGAVTSRAEIIRHAVRLVGSLSPSRVQSFLTKKRREAPAFMPGMDRRWTRRAQCPRAQQDPRSA
jgi:hypothetical protein